MEGHWKLYDCTVFVKSIYYFFYYLIPLYNTLPSCLYSTPTKYHLLIQNHLIMLLLLLSHFSRSDSVWPHRWQPTRLPRPWDSPGKNTGVGCHFLLQCMNVKSESEVAQLCPTLSDPTDCSLPGSSVHGIFQARVLEWSAIAFSKTHQWHQYKIFGPDFKDFNFVLINLF